MTIVYSRLCDVESGRKNNSTLFWLIPILIIWANIHGGVLGGLFTLLIAAAGWTLACRLGLKSPFSNKKALIHLWVIILLCFATPLVNPYGLKLPVTWMDIMGSSAVSQLIQEHASVVTLLHFGETSSLRYNLPPALPRLILFSPAGRHRPEGSKGHLVYSPGLVFPFSVANPACASFCHDGRCRDRGDIPILPLGPQPRGTGGWSHSG